MVENTRCPPAAEPCARGRYRLIQRGPDAAGIGRWHLWQAGGPFPDVAAAFAYGHAHLRGPFFVFDVGEGYRGEYRGVLRDAITGAWLEGEIERDGRTPHRTAPR